MTKTINARVSNPEPLTGKTVLGDRHSRLYPDICLWEVEDYDKYDSGDDEVIHVKIDKSYTANKKNSKNQTFPVIKYFDHQHPKVVHMLHNIMVG